MIRGHNSERIFIVSPTSKGHGPPGQRLPEVSWTHPGGRSFFSLNRAVRLGTLAASGLMNGKIE